MRAAGLALLLAAAFVAIPLTATDTGTTRSDPVPDHGSGRARPEPDHGLWGPSLARHRRLHGGGGLRHLQPAAALPELPLPVSLAGGGLIAGAVGLVVGLPSLRIKGFYLIAPTLAAQFLIEWVFNQVGWFSNYASSSAISARGSCSSATTCRARPDATPDTDQRHRRHGAGVAPRRKPDRPQWRAVRDGETAAAVIGVPVARAKLSAFFVGAAVSGVAGALWAFAYLGTVDARSFDLDRSFQAMFIIIIGGLSSLSGSFIGAAFIVLTPILLTTCRTRSSAAASTAASSRTSSGILFGALIIGFLIKEPNGLAALLGRLRRPPADPFPQNVPENRTMPRLSAPCAPSPSPQA